MRRMILAALSLVFAATSAYAQVSDSVTVVTVTGTPTTSAAPCLPQRNGRKGLTLDATGATANIGYCEGDSCTPAIGTAGTTTLAYGTLHYWPAPSAPRNSFNCISASGSQPLTIREGN